MKKKWSEVRRGDVVLLSSRSWTVEKTKMKGDALRVVVVNGSHRAESKVAPSAKVVVVKEKTPSAVAAPKPKSSPSTAADGDPWETQADRIEKRLDRLLGARLVGETGDDRHWYVPLVDVTTVAAHLSLFHEARHLDVGDEGKMVELHAREHIDKDWAGLPLHTHTEKRPK